MGLADRLPEHLRQPETTKAITAPSAFLLAGTGAGAAILGGLPIVAAVGIGVAAYGVRVAVGLPRKPRPERIDLAGLFEPWRHFVREALASQGRYRRAVEAATPGPLRDRLHEIGTRIDAGVRECYRIARRGVALERGLRAVEAGGADRQLTALIDTLPPELQPELRRAHGAGRGITAAAERAGVDSHQVQTIRALEAQLGSASRLGVVAREARDQVSLLNARLDEAVARAVELSLRAQDVAELSGVGGDVEALVHEMELLRAALEEADTAGRGGRTDRDEGGGTSRAGTA